MTAHTIQLTPNAAPWLARVPERPQLAGLPEDAFPWGYSSGDVAKTFFDRSHTWFRTQVGQGNFGTVVPALQEIAPDRTRTRRWNLAAIEQAAMHLHRARTQFDDTELLRTLEVVYAAAILTPGLRGHVRAAALTPGLRGEDQHPQYQGPYSADGQPVLRERVTAASEEPQVKQYTWRMGSLCTLFLGHDKDWLNNQARKDDFTMPEPPVRGPYMNSWRWRLTEIREIAIGLANRQSPNYDGQALLYTLEMIYAVARRQGLLPSY